MEFILLVVIFACLGVVFYATRSKPVQDKLKEHIQAAEVIITSEIKEDTAKLEVKAEELKKDVQAVTEEVKAVVQDVQVATAEVAAVVEEVKKTVKKVSKPKATKTAPAKEPKAKTTTKGSKKAKKA